MFRLSVAITALILGASGASAACPKDRASAKELISGRSIAASQTVEDGGYTTRGIKILGVQPTKLKSVNHYGDLSLLNFELPGAIDDYTKAFAASYPKAWLPYEFVDYGNKVIGAIYAVSITESSGRVLLKCQYS